MRSMLLSSAWSIESVWIKSLFSLKLCSFTVASFDSRLLKYLSRAYMDFQKDTNEERTANSVSIRLLSLMILSFRQDCVFSRGCRGISSYVSRGYVMNLNNLEKFNERNGFGANKQVSRRARNAHPKDSPSLRETSEFL